MRVLVVDDHSLFRDGIVSLLEAAGFQVIHQAGDGVSALEAAQKLRPELVLLDIAMPQLDGLTTLRRLKSELPGTKVVMLTVSDEDDDILKAVEAGADGYLLKNLQGQEFIRLLQGLQHGAAAMTPITTKQLMRGLAGRRGRSSRRSTDLTPREIDLLTLVAQGLANKEIARQRSISENTVKYHMKNILQKLHVHNRTEAVTLALRQGLIKPDQASPPGSLS